MKLKILEVSTVSKYIKSLLESDIRLNNLYIKGEISSVKKSKRGIVYFSIKDKYSSLPCVLYNNGIVSSEILIEGIEVLIKGSLVVYDNTGVYKIQVNDVEVKDIGELHKEYLKLEKQMAELGYFDIKNKKTLPKKISKIALITSDTSAAKVDFLTVLNRRNPFIEVDLYDAFMQGNNCVNDIVNKLNLAKQNKDYDLIAVTRGGGSKEDLFVFNNIEICRSIYESKIPVVVAIGHEVDKSLCEFVADLRAGTPSMLAELITENFYKSYIGIVKQYDKHLTFIVNDKLKNKKNNIALLSNRLNSISSKKISKGFNDLKLLKYKLENSAINRINSEQNNIDVLIEKLKSNDVTNILSKGYSILYKDDLIVRDKLKVGDVLNIKTQWQKLGIKVLEVEDE